MIEEITPEEIAQHYSAMLDSVTLIATGKVNFMSDEEWLNIKSRNIEHLELMAAKGFWTDQDFTEINKLINL